MSPDQLERILSKIDEVVGPPEDETEEDHQRRLIMVARDAEARRIRKAG